MVHNGQPGYKHPGRRNIRIADKKKRNLEEVAH